MSYLQLKIPASDCNAEEISELLLNLGALSITFTDQHDQPIFEPSPNETPLWSALWINAIFPAESNLQDILHLLENLSGTPFPLFNIMKIEEEDWISAWQKSFHAMQFGKRLWICPTHESVQDKNAVIITLDAGLAFGTGTHPTTHLCLEWLDDHIRGGETMIDYGCGSGILAIAAAKLGVSEVIAVDIDPQALTATRSNAEKNNIDGNRLKTLLPEQLTSKKVDIIVANILLNPLLDLASRFYTLLKPNGKLVLTGILASQVVAIKNKYTPTFELITSTNREEWVRMEYIKKN
jgi:ribosomal protein L11 methyltransferase